MNIPYTEIHALFVKKINAQTVNTVVTKLVILLPINKYYPGSVSQMMILSLPVSTISVNQVLNRGLMRDTMRKENKIAVDKKSLHSLK